jgi:redox-regulated HSP33 family molecular chaperone
MLDVRPYQQECTMKKTLVLLVLAFMHTILAFGQTYTINYSGDGPENSIIITQDTDGKVAVSASPGRVLVKKSTDGNTSTTADPNGRWEIIVTEGDTAAAQSNGPKGKTAANGNAATASGDGTRTVVEGQGYTIYINSIE